MEECEALCTRLAIMVNGQFKCLGSVQKLKNKFGEGYSLMAKVSGSSAAEIEQRLEAFVLYMDEKFPGNRIKDIHQGLVDFQIFAKAPDGSSVTWSQLFTAMEEAKEKYHLEDYSVSQTTLEQVFINFARNQKEPVEEKQGCFRSCRNCFCFFCCRCCTK